MRLNKYQLDTMLTAVYPDAGEKTTAEITYLTLGLASEAGEVAGKWKKKLRDGKFDNEAFIHELGDCFWYLARLCEAMRIDAETVLEINYNKLISRYERNTISGNGDTR